MINFCFQFVWFSRLFAWCVSIILAFPCHTSRAVPDSTHTGTYTSETIPWCRGRGCSWRLLGITTEIWPCSPLHSNLQEHSPCVLVCFFHPPPFLVLLYCLLTWCCLSLGSVPAASPTTAVEPSVCGQYEVACATGTCIDFRLRCNTRDDCGDGSDEVDCGVYHSTERTKRKREEGKTGNWGKDSWNGDKNRLDLLLEKWVHKGVEKESVIWELDKTVSDLQAVVSFSSGVVSDELMHCCCYAASERKPHFFYMPKAILSQSSEPFGTFTLWAITVNSILIFGFHFSDGTLLIC